MQKNNYNFEVVLENPENKEEIKDFKFPDETRGFNNGKMEILNIAGGVVGRIHLEPGWRWSRDVKPIVGTEWCEAPHFQYLISGRLHVLMESGNEFDLEPGMVSWIPAGHDAWVVGDEPVIGIDWHGATNYAK